MAMWLVAVLLIAALMVPITAILLDSPLGRSIAHRLEGERESEGTARGEVRELQRRVEVLESDLNDLREELQFVQRLLEDPSKKKPSP